MDFLDPLLKQKKRMFIYHLFCVAFVLKTHGEGRGAQTKA